MEVFYITRKEDYRRKILNFRKKMDKNCFIAKSNIIQKKVILLISNYKIKTLACYMSYNEEVETKKILSFCLYFGIQIVFPRIIDNNMDFFLVQNSNQLTLSSKYGFLEPNRDSLKVDLNQVDAFLVPGIAFDLNGFRIGYGKGFYDQFFKKNPFKRKIGIAFDFQVFHHIPHNDFDEKMNSIITETKNYLL